MVGVEKYRHTAEMVFRLNGHVIQGKSSTTEMYGSVDQLVDKILRQVRKRKEQLVDHKARYHKGRAKTGMALLPRPLIKTSRPALLTLRVEEAVGHLDGQASGILVFVSADSGRIQVLRRSENGTPEIIDPQPA
jgi:putative sigma-54 modulation protein